MTRTRVFIACSGLGRVARGYEAFFRDCFDALRDDPALDLTLFKAAGPCGPGERRLWSLDRAGRPARAIGTLLGRSGYFVEQATFGLSLIPHLLLGRPDLVYVSDVVLANGIRLLQQWLRKPWRVLFCNGGAVTPALLSRWDHVQQVSPEHVEAARRAGIPDDRQTLLPHALRLAHPGDDRRPADQAAARSALALPADRRVVLAVGALSAYRKRMDYVIREVARLPSPRPLLVMLGQRAADTPAIVALAAAQLGADGFIARTVDREEVAKYYRAADVFVLATLDEGFGLAYVEALAQGIPCVAHDYVTARYVLGDAGHFSDLTRDGALAARLSALAAAPPPPEQVFAQRRQAYDRFSWEALRPRYVALFTALAGRAPRAV